MEIAILIMVERHSCVDSRGCLLIYAEKVNKENEEKNLWQSL